MKGDQDIDDVTIGITNGTYKVKEDQDVNKPSEDQDVNKPSEKSDDEKKDENMQTVGFFQVFRYADKVDVLLMLLGIICACGNGACLPALMIVFGDMTDIFVSSSSFNNATLTEIASCDLSKYGVTLGEVVADLPLLGQVLTDCNKTALYNQITSTFQQGLVDEITKYAIYFFIIGGVVLITAYGQVAFWRIASYRQAQIIRIRSFQNIMRMEIGWFDTHEVGELNTRLSDDINKISDGIGEKVGNFFQWTSTFVTGIIIGFVYGWKLSLVIMATSPLMVAGGAFTTWVMSAFTKSELQSYAKAGAVAEEVFGAIRTVVAFGGEQKESERYGSNLASARIFGIKKAAVSGGGMGLLYFVMFATYALAFWYGSKLVQNGEYTVGQMLIVFFCVLIGAYGLGNAAPNLQAYATARGAAYALWELLDRKSEIDSSSEEGKRPDSLHGNITFRNVHFNYPSRPEVPVLAGLSLDVKKGQTVALVGSSGCGKSTTVQLLQRFYDPLEGTVSIDDQEIRGLNIKWLREHIGMVSQEPVLFATTIKENILFGKDGVSDEDIVRAAQEANAHDFISKLPKKYDTMVGERGAQLSGGQKQRIAIARALVRDPRILLLDEATSALDTESEAVVQSALNKARMGRTTLVIAHRLSTIKNADHIYSLKDGKVFEDGTHDQLMEKGEEGIYYHLVMNQQSLENEDELEEETSKVELERQLSSGGKRHSFKRGVSRALSREESAVEEKEEDLPDVSMTRLMRVNAPEWLYMVLGCMAALINGAVMPAFAVIFAEIIAVFAKPPAEQERETNLYSAMFLVLGIVTALAMFFQAFMFGVSGENLTVRIRKMTFSAYMRQEIGFFDDHANGVGALCTRLSTDASAVQGATGVRVGSILRALSSIGTGLVIGFVYSWELTLLILAFIPFVVVSGALQMKILGGQGNKKNTALEEAGKVAIEGIENIRIVASLSKERFFINKYTELTDKPFRTGMKKAHFMGLAFSFSQALVYFAHAAAFWLGAYLVENGRTNFDDVFKVFAAIVFSAMAVGEASAFAPDYKKAKVAAARIFHMLDIEPSIDSASKEGVKLGNIKGEVEFHDVQFSYPTRASVKVLKGLNLEVKPGQKVALVGSSGCGKSTTVSLLERFYDPEQGSVTIDGRPLKEINVQSGRSKIGIVQQEPILFDTSIKENIAYGDNFSKVSMDRVIQAAKEANIHNFIAALPEGYETNVGDKGAQLSGGQKQRVAIARALIRNPKILLLDEATSALDTESEKVVQEALEHAQEGRTSIVIAHRLSTIQDADKIVVIDNGVVAEQGTHSDLIAQQGLYYNLQQAQLKKI